MRTAFKEVQQLSNLKDLDEEWASYHGIVQGPAVKEPPADPHKKCKAAGIAWCRGLLDTFRKKVTEAVTSICQLDKSYKGALLDGFFVLALHGQQTQAVMTPNGAVEAPKPDELRFFHISYVMGGLKQFFPIFAPLHYLKPGPDQWPPASSWPEKAELQLQEEDNNFMDYFEFLQFLDIGLEWAIQIYQLSSSSVVLADLIPSVISVEKLRVPQYVAWKGAAAYRTKRPRQRAAPKPAPVLSLFLADDPGRDTKPEASQGQAPTSARSKRLQREPHVAMAMGSEQQGEELDADNDNGFDLDLDLFDESSDDDDNTGAGAVSHETKELEAQVQDFLAESHEEVQHGPPEGAPPERPPEGRAPEGAPERPPQVPAQADGQADPPAAEPVARVERGPIAKPGTHPQLDVVVNGEKKSFIKHKPQAQDVFAKCPIHPNCWKTKTLKSSTRNRNQGRPLGFLAAWVAQASDYESKDDHIHLCRPSFQERKAARQTLKAEANSPMFFGLERAQAAGEDSEPDACP